MPIPLILDTDIGGDVDDCLALGLALASPELDLAAVTTVYGDVPMRARIALKLLRLADMPALPVACGAEGPLNVERPLLHGRDEGHGILSPDDKDLQPRGEHAADLIIEATARRPGGIHLVAIGALTNIALALIKDPSVAGRLAGLTVMGGVVGEAGARVGGEELPEVDYNFACDPEAARIVVSSGVHPTIVPLDVTLQVSIFGADVAAIRQPGDPYHAVLAQQIEAYARYRKLGHTYLHDPLALASVLRPDLFTWNEVHAEVELGGRTDGKLRVRAPGADAPPNARVATAVDVEAAHDFIAARLSAAFPSPQRPSA